MKKVLILSTALILAIACREETKEKAKEAIDKSSKTVEETANKIVDEVSSHIDRDMGCTVVVSEPLKERGLSTGKFYIENDTVTKNDNKLVVYVITEKAFKGDVTFKVADTDGTELGRTTVKMDTKAGAAGYQDIQFDKRTDIENKSTITIY